MDISSVFSFNTTSGNFEVYIPGAGGTLSSIEPGRGYWVNATQNMTWMFDEEKYVAA
jgi:hypothetical protein